MPFVPRLLSNVLPTMSHDVDSVRQAANKVNTSLTDYIMSLSEDMQRHDNAVAAQSQARATSPTLVKDLGGVERRESNLSNRLLKTSLREQTIESKSLETKDTRTSTPADDRPSSPSPRAGADLDYQAAVNALTLQFLNEHEATRVAAIAWLIMLHKMAPSKVISPRFFSISRS
jgi:vacuole morphology and inheritance protein 14